MSGLNGVFGLKQTRQQLHVDTRSGPNGISRVLEPDPVNLSNYFYDRSKLSAPQAREVELYLAAKPRVRIAYEQTISNEDRRRQSVEKFVLNKI
jgi:hypothetical protein